MRDFNVRNGRRVGSILIAAVLIVSTIGACLVSNSKNSKADEVKENITYEELLPVMEEVAEGYAEAFAQNIVSEEVSSEKVTPIYDISENIVGYSVALQKDNVDYGYVSIDYTSEGLVTDFAVQENVDSIYESLKDDFVNKADNVEESECTNKLYSTVGADYAVSAIDNGEEVFYYNAKTYEDVDFDKVLEHYEENYLEYYDNTEYEDEFVEALEDDDNEMLQGPIKDFFLKWLARLAPSIYNKFFADDFVQPTPYPVHSEVFKYSKDVLGELSEPVMLDVYDPAKSMISQYTIMTTTGKYACALVAVTEIVQQEDMMINNDLKTTFDTLWDIGGCEANIYDTSEFYGQMVKCSSTYSNDLGRILREYGKLVGKDVVGRYSRNVGFKAFKESIDGGHSTTLGYQIKNEGGHGVNVVGYCKGEIAGHELNYLVAANGWHDDAPRYVLYDRYLFDSTGMTSFTIN